METFNYKQFLQENRNSLIAMVKEEMRFDLSSIKTLKQGMQLILDKVYIAESEDEAWELAQQGLDSATSSASLGNFFDTQLENRKKSYLK